MLLHLFHTLNKSHWIQTIYTSISLLPLLFILYLCKLGFVCISPAYANTTSNIETTIEVPFENKTNTQNRLTPSLDWFLDSSGQLTLNQILSPEIQRTFSSFLFTKLPKKEGTFWFRLTLDSTSRLSSPEIILDLNKRIPNQFPGQAQVWIAAMGSGKGMLIKPIGEDIYPIKYSGSEVLEVYIRLPGAPGFGFSPVLWTEDSFSNISSSITTLILFLLLIALIFCIFRGLIEKQEWRIWAALYAGTIFISILWGLPQTPEGVLTILDMPGLLAPGIALFILPHIGRCLMQTRYLAPGIDTQLLFLTLPGLIISLLPLLPGYLWILPYLSLWPLGTSIFLPTAFLAVVRNLQKSKIFFTICVLPPLGMLPLTIPTSAIPQNVLLSLLNLLPLICLSISAFITVIINNPKPISGAIRRHISSYVEKALTTQPQPSDIENESNQDLEMLEQKLRAPLDHILKELTVLNLSLRSTPLQQHVKTIENTTEYLARVINDVPELFVSTSHSEKKVFDLNQLLLTIHNAVEKEAEDKNIALSWFIAPHLSKKYEGNQTQLAQVLYLLVESAVQATSKGLVQLRVQRVPDSTDPGYLLITVSDSGQGSPPHTRSSLALIHAWELANSTGGYVSMHSEPAGTSISFSIHLTSKQIHEPLSAKTLPSTSSSTTYIPRIIIADTNPNNRQLLTYYLDELPYEILEAQDVKSIYNIYKQSPGALIIFGPDFPENMVIETIGAIRVFEGEHNFPLTSIIAICKTENQVEKSLRVGCTHTILEPIFRKELRHLTLCLAPIPQRAHAMFDLDTESSHTQTFFNKPTQLSEPNVQPRDEGSHNKHTKDFDAIDLLNPITPVDTLSMSLDKQKQKKSLKKKEKKSNLKSTLDIEQKAKNVSSNKNYKIEQYQLLNSSEWVGEPMPIQQDLHVIEEKKYPSKIQHNIPHENELDTPSKSTTLKNTPLPSTNIKEVEKETFTGQTNKKISTDLIESQDIINTSIETLNLEHRDTKSSQKEKKYSSTSSSMAEHEQPPTLHQQKQTQQQLDNQDKNIVDEPLELAPLPTKEKTTRTQKKTSSHTKQSLSLLDMITIPNEENPQVEYSSDFLSMDQNIDPIPPKNSISPIEPLHEDHEKNQTITQGIPNLFAPSSDTKTIEPFSTDTSEEKNTDQLDMMHFFNSTLNIVEGKTLSNTSKEFFDELDITLGLLQQAIKTNQSENLISFSQVIISLSEQLQSDSLTKLSHSLLKAIQSNKHEAIEKLITDITIEVKHNQTERSISG